MDGVSNFTEVDCAFGDEEAPVKFSANINLRVLNYPICFHYYFNSKIGDLFLFEPILISVKFIHTNIPKVAAS